jgi:hypothetical protein
MFLPYLPFDHLIIVTFFTQYKKSFLPEPHYLFYLIELPYLLIYLVY